MTLLEGRPTRRGADLDAAAPHYEVLYDHLAVTHAIQPSDAILCFGSRDPAVPVRAAALHAAGVAPYVVATGGIALRPGRSEADVIADELVRLGVPADRIVVERQARHTGENVELGMAALHLAAGRVRHVTSVAWPFAARRCVATLARHHPGLGVTSAPSFDEPGRRTPLTATSARWAVEQFDRLVAYRARGWIDEPAAPDDVSVAADVLRDALR